MDRSVAASVAAGKLGGMERQAGWPRNDPAVVVTNPDDAVTSDAFRAWLDRRQSGEPLHLPVRAVDTLAELRSTGEA